MAAIDVQVSTATQVFPVGRGRFLEVIDDWCEACGICMDMCPHQVLGADPRTKAVVVMIPESCDGCGICELTCPDYVFNIREASRQVSERPS